MSSQVMIVFSFASDWLRRRREFVEEVVRVCRGGGESLSRRW